jgi:phosphate transport system substrate-binding protein
MIAPFYKKTTKSARYIHIILFFGVIAVPYIEIFLHHIEEENMKKSLFIIALLVPTFVSAGSLRYDGSSTIGKIIDDAKAVYKTSTFSVDVISESSGGEQCAVRKTCDLGGVAREVEPKILEQGIVPTLVAKDAIAAIVHKDNPINGLSVEQLRGIFTGKITNWSQVGGMDLPIQPYMVKAASATRDVFAKHVLNGENYGENVKVATPDATMVTTVAKNLGGIGQISFSFFSDFSNVKPLIIDAQEPSVNNPHYSINRPLYIVTNGQPSGEAKAFLDWLLSPEGQAVVKKRFVGVK